MAQKPNAVPNKKWKVDEKCEIYGRDVNDRKRWIEATIMDIFKDEDGEWVMVKYNERTIKAVPPNDKNLRAISLGGKRRLNWNHVVEAVKQELYPMISMALGQTVEELMYSKTLEPATKEVSISSLVAETIDELKEKRIRRPVEKQFRDFKDQIIDYFEQSHIDSDRIRNMMPKELAIALVDHCGTRKMNGAANVLLKALKEKLNDAEETEAANNSNDDDLSDNATGMAIEMLQRRKKLLNGEIEYLKALIQRAVEYGKQQSSVNDIYL